MGGAKKLDAQNVSYARKIRKPFVEKQRRERMNKSISLLKSLIAQTIKQNTAPMTRVDKADILELAVYHLTQLQKQQQSVTMARKAAAFSAGYKACAQEAVMYLAKTKMTSDTAIFSLRNHLDSSFLSNSRQQEPTYHNYVGDNVFDQSRQTNRLSTPLRPCDTRNTSLLPELNLSGYSPILNGTNTLPELTSSFVQASLDSSSSISSGFLSASFIETTSTYSSSDYSKDDDASSENDINDIESYKGVVTIGNGKENEVGHVIKEVLWRPF